MTYTNLFSFYRSSEWESLRSRITLERIDENGDLLCEHCHKPIVKAYDAICHHKIELTEGNVNDALVALNPDNIMVVHHRCHNQIHERFGYQQSMTRHIYIVWGSPCAGKAEYVRANAGKGDMIIDLDKLFDALGVDGNRGAVKSNVLQLYRVLTDMVKTRNGKWRCVWIIRTLPLPIDRDMIVRDLGGGELIHIDTPEEECLRVAKERGGDWLEWTEKYWERFKI